MIRIAYIVNRFVPGGLKTYLLSYASAMDRSKFDITFIACENKNDPVSYADLEREGIKVIELASIKNLPVYCQQLKRTLKEHRFDIVQACMNSLNLFPLLVAKKAGVPRRISCNLSTSHPSERSSVIKDLLKRFGTTGATDFIANSDLSAKWLFGNRSSEAKVFPNALVLSKYEFDDSARQRLREELGISDCFVIGNIARYCHQKNHKKLVEVFKCVHDNDSSARLLLVGWGELKPTVFAQIHSLGLQDHVIDLGATENLAAIYSSLDCFVLPSYYEGLPVVGIEAQASGCPCVFSSEITREVELSDEVAFVSLDDPPSKWAQVILQYKDVERFDCVPEMSQKGYDLYTEVKALEAFYEEGPRDRSDDRDRG